MLVNDSDAARSVTLKVPGAPVALTLKQYNYFDSDRPVDKDGFPAVKATLEKADFGAGINPTSTFGVLQPIRGKELRVCSVTIASFLRETPSRSPLSTNVRPEMCRSLVEYLVIWTGGEE